MDPYTLEILKTIQGACLAVKGVTDVMMSPEGQASMMSLREGNEEFRKGILAIGKWIENTFTLAFSGTVDESGNAGLKVNLTGGK